MASSCSPRASDHAILIVTVLAFIVEAQAKQDHRIPNSGHYNIIMMAKVNAPTMPVQTGHLFNWYMVHVRIFNLCLSCQCQFSSDDLFPILLFRLFTLNLITIPCLLWDWRFPCFSFFFFCFQGLKVRRDLARFPWRLTMSPFRFLKQLGAIFSPLSPM